MQLLCISRFVVFLDAGACALVDGVGGVSGSTSDSESFPSSNRFFALPFFVTIATSSEQSEKYMCLFLELW